MNRYTLRLYRSKRCNMHCGYCNIDYSNINEELTNDDIINFISDDRNYYNIDKRNLYLYGGEPTLIYDNEILSFFNKHFYNITMITNFMSEDDILRIVNLINHKVKFIVSLNDDSLILNNIKKYKDYILELHMVLTEHNIQDIIKYVSLANEIDKPIRITPENSSSDYEYDYEKLTETFTSIYNDKLEYNLLNYHDVRRGCLHKKYDECLNSNLVISNSGNLYSCEYYSDVYTYENDNPIGTIHSVKLNEYKPTAVDCDHCVSKDNANFNKSRIDNFDQWLKDFTINFDYQLTPKTVLLFLTEDCNLKCEYCFEKDKKNTHKKMSISTIKKYVDFAWFSSSADNPINLLMFGGEPTLCLDSVEFIRLHYLDLLRNSHHNGALTFTINTNLVLMNDEVVETLAKFAETVKYFDISVSLDGCRETQNRRLPNSYNMVLNNVKLLRSKLNLREADQTRVGDGVTISKSSTIMYDDYEYIYDSVESMINELDIFDMFTIGYATDCYDDQSDEVIGENMYKCWKVIDSILNNNQIINTDYGEIIKSYLAPINIRDYVGEPHPDCGVLKGYFVVKANGTLLPCHSCFGLDNETPIPTHDISDTDGKLHIKYGTTEYHFYNGFIKEFKNGYVDVVVDGSGVNCKDCNYFNLCKCIKHSRVKSTSTFVRKVEDCMRNLKQAEIFLEFVKVDHERELKELQELEYKKMTQLDSSMSQLCDTQKTIIDVIDIMTGDNNE